MKKQLLLPLFFVFILNTIQAQEATKKEILMETSNKLSLEAREKFSKAVLLAKQNGWL